MTTDLLKTLEAMRPDTGADRLWPQPMQAAVRARIMDATTTQAVSGPTGRSKRVAVVVLTAAVVTGGGVGAVAATGLMPTAFTDHYYFWKEPGVVSEPGAEPVDPATAKRIGSIPGPDGTVFSVFEARSAGSQRCVKPVFESAASAERPGPSEFTDLGSRCRHAGDGAFGFGAGAFGVGTVEYGAGGDGERTPSALTYDAMAGTAVRAELRLSTGQVLPTILSDGSFFGWLPWLPAGSPRPVLTGYSSDGAVVGSIEIGPNF